MVQIITDTTFDNQVINSQKPVLVDFWAPWCGPCKMMVPIFEELSKEYIGKPIKFGKMDIDENGETPSKYGVMSIPTFMLFKQGKPVDQLMGIQKKEDLKKKADELLK